MMESRNAALDEGSTDGKYRKARPNTKIVDPVAGAEIVAANRRGLHSDYYDMIMQETPSQVNPGYR